MGHRQTRQTGSRGLLFFYSVAKENLSVKVPFDQKHEGKENRECCLYLGKRHSRKREDQMQKSTAGRTSEKPRGK